MIILSAILKHSQCESIEWVKLMLFSTQDEGYGYVHVPSSMCVRHTHAHYKPYTLICKQNKMANEKTFFPPAIAAARVSCVYVVLFYHQVDISEV